MPQLLSQLDPYDPDAELWRVVVETPRGSHNKYAFDEELGHFIFRSVLPEGMTFPFDFGFLPSTLGEDGDPLDVLLLMDQPAFTGCVVAARLIGVIEAEQTEKDGQRERNDRLVAVLPKDTTYSDCKSVKDLNQRSMEQVEQFFVNYNQLHGKKFKLLGLHGPAKAESLARDGMKAFQKRHHRKRAKAPKSKR